MHTRQGEYRERERETDRERERKILVWDKRQRAIGRNQGTRSRNNRGERFCDRQSSSEVEPDRQQDLQSKRGREKCVFTQKETERHPWKNLFTPNSADVPLSILHASKGHFLLVSGSIPVDSQEISNQLKWKNRKNTVKRTSKSPWKQIKFGSRSKEHEKQERFLFLGVLAWASSSLLFRKRAEYGLREYGFKHRTQWAFLGSLSSGERTQWVPLSLLFVCQSELTEFFSQSSPSLPRNSVRLSEFSSPKQYSRNSIPPVSYSSRLDNKRSLASVRHSHVVPKLRLARKQGLALSFEVFSLSARNSLINLVRRCLVN